MVEIEPIILVLSGNGIKILKICDRIYYVSWFESATPTLLKHKIKGRDVTQILSSTGQLANSSEPTMLLNDFFNRVDAIKESTIEFHHSYPFVYYAN